MNDTFINKNIGICLKSQLKKFDFLQEDYKEIKKINLSAFDYGNNFISNSLEDLTFFPNISELDLSHYIINRPNVKIIESLSKIDSFEFYECDFRDDLNICGKYINVCSCEHISYIDFNNFEEIRIENCDISKIKFNNCKKIELKYVRLNNENIDYINSLTNNIILISCIYNEKSEFNNNVIIINNEDYLGGL